MRHLLISLLLFAAHVAAAQVHICNFRLTRPGAAVLYTGISNAIAVSVPGYKAAQLNISFPGVSVTYKKTNRDTVFLEVTTSQPGTVHMQVTDRNTHKKLGTVDFVVVRLPDWRIQPGYLERFEATKAQLLAQPGLVYASADTLLRPYITVLHYEFTAFKGDEIFGTVKVSGPAFTEEVRNMIRSLPRNSRISADDIKVTGPDNRMRACNPITILVTE